MTSIGRRRFVTNAQAQAQREDELCDGSRSSGATIECAVVPIACDRGQLVPVGDDAHEAQEQDGVGIAEHAMKSSLVSPIWMRADALEQCARAPVARGYGSANEPRSRIGRGVGHQSWE